MQWFLSLSSALCCQFVRFTWRLVFLQSVCLVYLGTPRQFIQSWHTESSDKCLAYPPPQIPPTVLTGSVSFSSPSYFFSMQHSVVYSLFFLFLKSQQKFLKMELEFIMHREAEELVFVKLNWVVWWKPEALWLKFKDPLLHIVQWQSVESQAPGCFMSAKGSYNTLHQCVCPVEEDTLD